MLGLYCASLAAGVDDFVGSWEVRRMIEGVEPNPWSTEIRYPKTLTLTRDGNALRGRYRDQFDVACDFPVVVLLNDGRDLLLATCGVTKAPENFAPIHHVKRVAGRLHGVVTTGERLFEWVAERAD